MMCDGMINSSNILSTGYDPATLPAVLVNVKVGIGCSDSTVQQFKIVTVQKFKVSFKNSCLSHNPGLRFV